MATKARAERTPRPKAKPKPKRPPKGKRPPAKTKPPAKGKKRPPKKPRPAKKRPGKRPGKRPPRRETEPDRALVERTISLVRETDRAIVSGKRRVGAMILDEYFDGDPKLALGRGRSRPASFALLASIIEDTTGWDARDLNECVKIEIVARSLPPDLASQLPSSHLLRLATISNLRLREAIARRAAAGELRGDALKRLIAEEAANEDAAASSRPSPGKPGPADPPLPPEPGPDAGHGGGGRPRRPDAVVAVAALQRVVERATDDEAFTEVEIAEVRPRQREKLAKELDEASRTLAAWSRKLRASLAAKPKPKPRPRKAKKPYGRP